MYDCVTGQQIEDNYGCIMADEMVNILEYDNITSLIFTPLNPFSKLTSFKSPSQISIHYIKTITLDTSRYHQFPLVPCLVGLEWFYYIKTRQDNSTVDHFLFLSTFFFKLANLKSQPNIYTLFGKYKTGHP